MILSIIRLIITQPIQIQKQSKAKIMIILGYKHNDKSYHNSEIITYLKTTKNSYKNKFILDSNHLLQQAESEHRIIKTTYTKLGNRNRIIISQ